MNLYVHSILPLHLWNMRMFRIKYVCLHISVCLHPNLCACICVALADRTGQGQSCKNVHLERLNEQAGCHASISSILILLSTTARKRKGYGVDLNNEYSK